MYVSEVCMYIQCMCECINLTNVACLPQRPLSLHHSSQDLLDSSHSDPTRLSVTPNHMRTNCGLILLHQPTHTQHTYNTHTHIFLLTHMLAHVTHTYTYICTHTYTYTQPILNNLYQDVLFCFRIDTFCIRTVSILFTVVHSGTC